MVVPKFTCEVEASSVVHVIVADESLTLMADTPDMTGGVVLAVES